MRDQPNRNPSASFAGGAIVDYFDPLIPVVPMTRENADLADRESVVWDLGNLYARGAELIETDHDGVDYQGLRGLPGDAAVVFPIVTLAADLAKLLADSAASPNRLEQLAASQQIWARQYLATQSLTSDLIKELSN